MRTLGDFGSTSEEDEYEEETTSPSFGSKMGEALGSTTKILVIGGVLYLLAKKFMKSDSYRELKYKAIEATKKGVGALNAAVNK